MKKYKIFLKGTLTFLNGVYARSQRDGRRIRKSDDYSIYDCPIGQKDPDLL